MSIRNLPGLEYKTFAGGNSSQKVASTWTQEQAANQKRCVTRSLAHILIYMSCVPGGSSVFE